MKQYLQSLKFRELSQRGDSGTIYIVFIMALLIVGAYVMVGGLYPSFEETNAAAQQQQPGGSQFTNGPGGLPSLAPKGSEEYKRQKECAEEAKKGLSNPEIKKKGSVNVNC